MKFITHNVHEALDFFFGLALTVSPYFFGFQNSGPETIVPIIVGLAIIIFTALTDFKYTFFPAINIKDHLILDMIAGSFLIAAPFIFYFYGHVFVPHILFGALFIMNSFFTNEEEKDGWAQYR